MQDNTAIDMANASLRMPDGPLRMPDSPCLASLPVEILMAIVAKLGPSQADYDIFRDDYVSDLSLYYLAQT